MSDEITNKKEQEVADFDLDLHTYRLLQAEPFFAALSRRIHKSPTTAIPTAGVCMNEGSGNFEMIYNPNFFAKLSDRHKLGVLMHEMYHIVFEHVTGRLPPEGMSKMWNIATDLAINSHLMNELPEQGLFPTRDRFESYPVGMSAEWYYSKLQQDKENEEGAFDPEHNKGDGQGDNSGQGSGEPDTIDDHSGWGEASQETR